ncbi:hypothetical protein HK405_015292, partial [Cladochytrium tenue]
GSDDGQVVDQLLDYLFASSGLSLRSIYQGLENYADATDCGEAFAAARARLLPGLASGESPAPGTDVGSIRELARHLVRTQIDGAVAEAESGPNARLLLDATEALRVRAGAIKDEWLRFFELCAQVDSAEHSPTALVVFRATGMVLVVKREALSVVVSASPAEILLAAVEGKTAAVPLMFLPDEQLVTLGFHPILADQDYRRDLRAFVDTLDAVAEPDACLGLARDVLLHAQSRGLLLPEAPGSGLELAMALRDAVAHVFADVLADPIRTLAVRESIRAIPDLDRFLRDTARLLLDGVVPAIDPASLVPLPDDDELAARPSALVDSLVALGVAASAGALLSVARLVLTFAGLTLAVASAPDTAANVDGTGAPTSGASDDAAGLAVATAGAITSLANIHSLAAVLDWVSHSRVPFLARISFASNSAADLTSSTAIDAELGLPLPLFLLASTAAADPSVAPALGRWRRLLAASPAFAYADDPAGLASTPTTLFAPTFARAVAWTAAARILHSSDVLDDDDDDDDDGGSRNASPQSLDTLACL